MDLPYLDFISSSNIMKSSPFSQGDSNHPFGISLDMIDSRLRTVSLIDSPNLGRRILQPAIVNAN